MLNGFKKKQNKQKKKKIKLSHKVLLYFDIFLRPFIYIYYIYEYDYK